MTLILTAICTDDICVCADTRYQDTKWSEGFKDGFDKIHKFNSYPLIIFNHGINEFDGKYWDYFCREYENSGRWKGKNLDDISKDFKNFIEPIVLRQLNSNINAMPNNKNYHNSGFVLCGKDSQGGSYKVYEFFWNPKLIPNQWSGKRLIGTGIGYENYLKGDIDNLINYNNFNYKQIKKELERLFSKARERKKEREKKNPNDGKEFSDDFIIKCIEK